MGRRLLKIKRKVLKFIYFSIAAHLPRSYNRGGNVSKKIRYFCCKRLFRQCGKNVNIENRVKFGHIDRVSIGDNSGIGEASNVEGRVSIGNNVMIGQEVLILTQSHAHSDLTIPMKFQGLEPERSVSIGNDVWIGTRAIICLAEKLEMVSSLEQVQ